MDEKIKALLQELGDAINDVVTHSARVEAIMEAIRDSGYEVYLTLEANIAVEDKGAGSRPPRAKPAAELTEDDRRFLKRLRIDS